MVAELDDTLHCFMDVHWDSVWATHGCLLMYHVEDMHYVEVGPGPTL
jgi:hypothetical protein